VSILKGDRGLVAALALACAVITSAILFEQVGGLAPCPLCLQQRYAYYAGIPGLLAAFLLSRAGSYHQLAIIVSALVILVFLANAGLAGYHAGVEWKLWAGPATCSATGTLKPISGNLLDALKSGPPAIRCDEAAWRLFSLSLAGWNLLASTAVAALVGGALVKG
jgi:disulfide bond formation protein DsbB